MSIFSEEEVARLADLAHIALTPQETVKFTTELNEIAEKMSKVSEIVTDDIPMTSHPIPLQNVWREDDEIQEVDIEAVLASAPAHEDGKFMVPPILGEDA
ncbi:Asp-tRNA(Asn)/Glu-tRNA(Gln) amidotransferase subunit GatC [Trueperella sp. LYQ143]|uniref:Asp-tRNA(Asn)/Glu-tRNA(Gln) amidotransferase subunit GatC n=1 Tax=unclassified Trueperella TaxID=2630174 RepID=UPI003982FA54